MACLWIPNKPDEFDLLLLSFHSNKSARRSSNIELIENHQIIWYSLDTSLLRPKIITLLASAFIMIPISTLPYKSLAASKCERFWIAVLLLIWVYLKKCMQRHLQNVIKSMTLHK